MKKVKALIFVLGIILFLSACGKKTVQPEQPISLQEKYIQEHPDLKEEIKQNILEGVVTIGMTEGEVRASWGNPDQVEVFTSEYNSYKRWIYKDRPKVYMKDGKVDQLQK